MSLRCLFVHAVTAFYDVSCTLSATLNKCHFGESWEKLEAEWNNKPCLKKEKKNPNRGCYCRIKNGEVIIWPKCSGGQLKSLKQLSTKIHKPKLSYDTCGLTSWSKHHIVRSRCVYISVRHPARGIQEEVNPEHTAICPGSEEINYGLVHLKSHLSSQVDCYTTGNGLQLVSYTCRVGALKTATSRMYILLL